MARFFINVLYWIHISHWIRFLNQSHFRFRNRYLIPIHCQNYFLNLNQMLNRYLIRFRCWNHYLIRFRRQMEDCKSNQLLRRCFRR